MYTGKIFFKWINKWLICVYYIFKVITEMRVLLLRTVSVLFRWIFNICVLDLALVEGIVSQNNHNVCPEESTQLDLRKIIWNSTGSNNEIVLSYPPCLDKSKYLSVRICSNNSWIPKDPPTCHEIIEEQRYCPKNFLEVKDACVFITKPISWPWKHRYILRSDSRTEPLEVILNSSIWYPVARKTKFDNWRSTSMEDYGEIKKIAFHIEEDKDCVFINMSTKEMHREHCAAYHHQLLTFPKKENFNLCPENCWSAGLGTQKCYCIKTNDQCKNLIDMSVLLNRNILSILTYHMDCYFNANFLPPDLELQGFRPSWNGKAMRYTNKKLSCSICTVKALSINSKIELNFDKDMKKLYLTVYHPEGLYKNNKNKTVFCFTNANGYQVSSLEVKKSYEQTDNSLIVLEIELKRFMGLYWCEAFKIENMNSMIRSNTVIAYKEKNGHELALRLDLHINRDSQHYIPDEILHIFSHFHSKIRLMEIFESDIYHSDYLLHISTRSNDNITTVLSYFQNKLQTLPSNMHVIYFRSSEYCLPENTNLSWPQTKIDVTTLSNECCLQQNGIPVNRYCSGDFMYGTRWSKVEGSCYMDPPESSKQLQSLINKNMSHALLKDFINIISSEKEMPISDMYYVSKILQNVGDVSNNVTYIKDVTDITNALLSVSTRSFIQAQDFLNVTDDILDYMDDVFGKAKDYVKNDIFIYQKENFVVHITNPSKTKVSGIAVLKDTENNIIINNLLKNSTRGDIQDIENLHLAVYIPEDILNHFEEDIVVITTVFFNDRLFARPTKDGAQKPGMPIVGVIIPGHGTFLPGEIPILYKPSQMGFSPECAFWDYGKRTKRKKGTWSGLGGKHEETTNNGSILHVCYFTHLTHFSLLLIESESINLTKTDDIVLHIINLVADFLTTIGLIGIFLTALMFKNWSRKSGTKILLNMSIAIALEVIITQISQSNNSIDCQIFGALLHYIVIAKFCWMLVYAFLQYMRFVKVLGPLPDNIVIKSLVFGWGSPLIPVSITITLDSHNYSYNSLYNLCHPERWALFICYVSPIFLIICINAGVFCIVMYKVMIKKIDSHTKMIDSYKLQMQLATLLFFILGIPMLLILLVNIIASNWIKTILIYLFSITANIQGFILFLFYVIFNDETRRKWTRYYDQQKTSTTATSSRS